MINRQDSISNQSAVTQASSGLNSCWTTSALHAVALDAVQVSDGMSCPDDRGALWFGGSTLACKRGALQEVKTWSLQA